MPPSVGTRTKSSFQLEHPASAPAVATSYTRDIGMMKRTTPANTTFTAASSQISGVNGDLANFVVGDRVVVRGTSGINDGEHAVLGIDSVNHAFIVVDPPPKNQGPIAGVEIRTI